jgi:hypothetical protein
LVSNVIDSPDFGAGLSLDELIGLTAGQLKTFHLPNGEVYQSIEKAAERMLRAGLDAYSLMEVWADGHTLWHGIRRDDPVVVTPAGDVIQTQA